MSKSIKEEYEKIVGAYVLTFCTKQDLDFEFWVSDEVGTICCISGDFWFDFQVIKQDIDKDVPKGIVIEWYNNSLDIALNGQHFISYSTYLHNKKY